MKRKILWYILLVLAVSVVQHVFATEISIAGVKPNFYLVLTVATAVVFGQKDGSIIGGITGLIFDTQSSLPFGTHALLGLFVGLLAGLVHESQFKNVLVLEVLAACVATFAYELIMFTIAAVSSSEYWLSGSGVILSNYWYAISSVVWKAMIYNTVLSVPFYFLIGYVVRPKEKDDVVKSYTIRQ